MQVQLDADPTIKGFAGSYPTGDPQDVINNFGVRNVQLSQVLFAIVERSRRGSSWIATVDSTRVVKMPAYCPWLVLEYNQHWEDTAIFSTIASRLAEQENN